MADEAGSSAAGAPQPGWYPDPLSDNMRRWDGEGWTDDVRPIPPSSHGPVSGPAAASGADVPWWADTGGETPSWWQSSGPGPTQPTRGRSRKLDRQHRPWDGSAIVPIPIPRMRGRNVGMLRRPAWWVPNHVRDAVYVFGLGLTSLICCPLFAPFAIYSGLQARYRIRVSNGRLGGDGWALMGMIFASISIAFWLYQMYRAATGHQMLAPTTSTPP